MSLIINHNISALNTQRNLNTSDRALSKSLQKLSSGYKINVAADDPSGLIISEQLRSQTNGLQRAVRNSQEASNVIGIAEGALIEMNEILRKLRSLALHAANSGVTAPDQVRADQAEVDSSIQTLDRIANTTRYSDQFLLNGSKGLVFDRRTTVDDPMDHALLDVQSTRVDQVFKRAGVEMSVAFSGVLDANQADFSKEARRAYLEVDSNNADADLDATGTEVTHQQEFFLTGTRGSRLFNFAEGTTLGTITDAINNVRESTGIGATLTFNSAVVPDGTIADDVTGGAGARPAGAVQVYGDARLNDIANTPVDGMYVNTAAGAQDDFRVGFNTDGHGRVFAKVVDAAVPEVEWYKDEDLTMLIGTQSGNGTGNFTATNGSGIDTSFGIELDTAVAQVDDVFTVAIIGQENLGGANANVSGIDTWTGIDAANSVISGVELGVNTSSDGTLYFRAETTGGVRTVEVFNDSQMLPDSLVATGSTATPAAGNQVRLQAVDNGDGTNTNLNITLSFGGAMATGLETGTIEFQNLGMRVYSLDYGSQEYLRVENKQGQLFQTYNDGDNTVIEMVEVGSTLQTTGTDALISLNGAPLRTDGLIANVTTPDFSGALTFNDGELGLTTIAQSGYEVGALFSRSTALQTVSEGWAATTLTSAYTWATNARSQTGETLEEFIGGMQFQLGGGEGDQERTVYGIESMVSSNVGRIEIDDVVYTLQDVLAGGSASLTADPIIALRVVTQAVNDVSELRARLGAFQKNMLQTNINSLEVSIENIIATESSIRDANMASETTEFTKNQILMQAGTAMLAQANTASQNVLQLLG